MYKINRSTIVAHFTYNSCSLEADAYPDHIYGGRIVTHQGESSRSALPARQVDSSPLIDVDSDHFRGRSSKIGLNDSGKFRALSSMRRSPQSNIS